jgi:hypothetical protein
VPPVLLVYESPELESTVWRVVAAIPADTQHFLSFADLEIERPTANYLRLAGVSHYLTLAQVRKAARQWKLGDMYAELDLRQNDRIAYAVTSQQTGHVVVWAPPTALRDCVVNYATEP